MQSTKGVILDSLKGSQEARVRSVPAYASSSGPEVLEVGRLAGVELDPWQQQDLTDGLGESSDWKCPKCTHRATEAIRCPSHPRSNLIHPWAAFEVAEVVPRQNGKSELLIVRMLGGLFVLEEPLQIFSAHQFDTAVEIFLRLAFLISECDELRSQVKHRGGRMTGIKYGHGEEGIELQSGLRVRFKARTGGGGRGFSGDTLYLDEAMILPEQFLGATVPILSARPNPQIYLAGSPPDDEDPTHDGVVLAKRRKRALAGDDPSLAYFEHSAQADHPAGLSAEFLDDRKNWAAANPGLGIRITEEHVANERRAMGDRQFAIERLGVGAWPSVEVGNDRKISIAKWRARELVDKRSKAEGQVCLSFDITPDRSWGAIGLAGNRADGFGHVEVVEHKRTTAWMIDRLVDLALERDPVAIVWDKQSPASALENKLRAALEDAGVSLETMDGDLLIPVTSAEFAQACGMLFDEVEQQTFRHRDQPKVTAALQGAMHRMLHDEEWIWSRRLSNVDITTLITVTLARWGSQTQQPTTLEPLVAFR